MQPFGQQMVYPRSIYQPFGHAWSFFDRVTLDCAHDGLNLEFFRLEWVGLTPRPDRSGER